MGITENAAYLKGLFDGYELDKASKEGKIISGMLDLIADMADKIQALEEDNRELHELVDEIDADLGEVEEELYFTEGDEDEDEEYDDFDDPSELDDDELLDDEDGEFFEIECPACGETICFDDSLSPDDIVCPACGEKISEIEVCDGDCSGCSNADCESNNT